MERVEGLLLGPDGLAPGWVEVEDGRVAARGRGGPGGPVVAPGLVDLQVNGAAGVSVTDGPDAIRSVDEAMLDAGVTAWLPTVMTTDDETAARTVADCEALGLGVHLEGPFLSPAFPGAHPRGRLRVPADGVPGYFASPAVRLVTLAPELPGARELARELDARGVVVSLGHSDATPVDADAVPARKVTHLFNAMRPVHHRRPSLTLWALVHDSVAVGLIADGVHVGPGALRLARRAAGDRIVLVSDLAARELTPAGVLAGSTVKLDECVRRYVALAGASPAEALTAAAVRPARLAGVGSALEEGGRADLVVLDDGLRVLRVMRGGAWLRG